MKDTTVTAPPCPIWLRAPTRMMPEMAFVSDINGVCRAWVTLKMT